MSTACRPAPGSVHNIGPVRLSRWNRARGTAIWEAHNALTGRTATLWRTDGDDTAWQWRLTLGHPSCDKREPRIIWVDELLEWVSTDRAGTVSTRQVTDLLDAIL